MCSNKNTSYQYTYKEFEIFASLSKYIVEDMPDGGMGCLKFVYDNPLFIGSILVGGYFKDQDGVLVDLAINLYKAERVYELDIWKTDSEPLIRYPKPEDITILRP